MTYNRRLDSKDKQYLENWGRFEDRLEVRTGWLYQTRGLEVAAVLAKRDKRTFTFEGYVFHTKYQDMPREWESWTSDGYVYTMMNTLRDLMVPLFPLYMIDKKLVDPELPIKTALAVLRKYEKEVGTLFT